MDNHEIFNIEHLQDLIFEINEISSSIAVSYFRKEYIPKNEIALLANLKDKLSSATIMIESIINR
jgi:hypothetical protein